MTIYDPINRQQVTIVGRYPIQNYAWKFGERIEGTFRFALIRYGEHLPGFDGGYKVGTEREADINDLVADDGYSEIMKAYNAVGEITK